MEKQIRILYAEDDPNLSFVTKDNLELAGYEVLHTENGLEAFEEFKAGKFDLCILDVMMPIIDGFTLAKKIRRMNTMSSIGVRSTSDSSALRLRPLMHQSPSGLRPSEPYG